MFHDARIRFKFDENGRPLWAVSIEGQETPVVGFGPDLQTAAWEAQMSQRVLERGDVLATTPLKEEFFADLATPEVAAEAAGGPKS